MASLPQSARDRHATPAAAATFWWGASLTAVAFFTTKLLPCVDYPQHLALSDVARRLFDPAAPEHREFSLNLFTYNGLFHLLVAGLSKAIPVELAGRLVVAASVLLLAGAVAALLRVLRRPAVHGALFVPMLFSFSLGWGFVNYVLATSVAAWTLVFIAKVAERPRVHHALLIAVLGLVCAFAHVLAMLILCLVGAALALEVAYRAQAWQEERAGVTTSRRIGVTLLRSACALLPLLIGCVYCIAVYQRQYTWDPQMYRDRTLEGTAPPLWQKVVYFGAFASDLYGDATDQVLLWVSLAVMGWSAVARLHDHRSGVSRDADSDGNSHGFVAPLLATTIAYFATPMVLVGTHLIFPRLGQWAVLGAVLATPRFPGALAARAHRYIGRLSVLAGLNACAHCILFQIETGDASAVIDDLPPGLSATAIIWEPGTVAFRNGTLTHLAGYYAARKHGHWAFAFARYLSVPVRFEPGSQPPWPSVGWEFSAEDYAPRCRYARAFPLVIVRAPESFSATAETEAPLRSLVFKADASRVRLLSHHGRFWAFDTSAIAGDGSI